RCLMRCSMATGRPRRTCCAAISPRPWPPSPDPQRPPAADCSRFPHGGVCPMLNRATQPGTIMLSQIKGLHHVTALAADAQANNDFFTRLLGLRRVKKTVNFDAPDVYHLYYGDEVGTPGSVMTYFPFPHI